MLTVTDDLGRRVSLSAPAANIISLAPSVTETLFAVGAGFEIAGVTNFCNTRLPLSQSLASGGSLIQT